MKKLFILVLIICMIVTMFSITAFAVESVSADVIRSNRLYREASFVMIENYKTHAEGGDVDIYLAKECNTTKNISIIDRGSNESGSLRFGSIFGEGSLAMILSLVALVLSIASICISVSLLKNKKSLSSKKTDNEDKDEDEE